MGSSDSNPEVDVSNTTGLRVAADVVPVTRAVKFGVGFEDAEVGLMERRAEGE